ncbi:hypothetical protein [Sphingomonas sp. TREG-RG-20F-R18-01]|uniref:hypothetical protein n=1 Tax=Sphingomonas sp. TREG-RG-20F-R18-01 TaxID=2914982 RepID=UPI001F5721DD|nr:hypothetical protein [Sphingomonas sp. TREG-RG-20F-R18-01]
MVDWTQPIEAVRKADGFVFPVTLRSGPVREPYSDRETCTTVEVPDPQTTNHDWYSDGADRCVQDAWFIRNRVNVTVPRLSAADVAEARNAYFASTCKSDDSATFYAKRWGLLREETPAEKFSRETGITVTADIEAALAWAVSQ